MGRAGGRIKAAARGRPDGLWWGTVAKGGVVRQGRSIRSNGPYEIAFDALLKWAVHHRPTNIWN